MIVLLPILILLSSIINVFLTKNYIKIKQLEHENQLSVNQIESQYKYYKMKQEENQKIQHIRHDLKNHLLVLKSSTFLKQKEYLEQLIDEIESYNARFDTGNELIDTLLTEKAALASEKNIDIKIGLDISKIEFISTVDLVAILGNVLDNALEASMYCTKRKYIKIDGKIIEKFYVLICENSHNNQIIEKDKKLKTTKKDAQNHGFGISDIKRMN